MNKKTFRDVCRCGCMTFIQELSSIHFYSVSRVSVSIRAHFIQPHKIKTFKRELVLLYLYASHMVCIQSNQMPSNIHRKFEMKLDIMNSFISFILCFFPSAIFEMEPDWNCELQTKVEQNYINVNIVESLTANERKMKEYSSSSTQKKTQETKCLAHKMNSCAPW